MIRYGLDYDYANELLKQFVAQYDIKLGEHKGYVTLAKNLNKVAIEYAAANISSNAI